MEQKVRYFWIENLRAFACIGVVFLHVTGPSIAKFNELNGFSWSILLLLHSFSRMSVPIFLMITGVLLFNSENSSYIDYLNRIKRIVKPLVFWSIVYFLIYFTNEVYHSKEFSRSAFFKLMNSSLVSGAAYHFWYMYMLICFYLILPLLNSIVLKPKVFIVFLLFWFVLLTSTYFIKDTTFLNKPIFLFGHFGYLVLGYGLNKIQSKGNLLNVLAWLLLLFGLFFTFWPAYNSIKSNVIVDTSSFYRLRINVVLMAVGLFYLARNWNTRIWYLKLISNYSLEVYFVHLLFIMLVNKVPLAVFHLSFFILISFKASLVFAFSFICAYSFNKFTFLKKLIRVED